MGSLRLVLLGNIYFSKDIQDMGGLRLVRLTDIYLKTKKKQINRTCRTYCTSPTGKGSGLRHQILQKIALGVRTVHFVGYVRFQMNVQLFAVLGKKWYVCFTLYVHL